RGEARRTKSATLAVEDVDLPEVAGAGMEQRKHGQAAGRTDRALEIAELLEPRADVLVDRQVEAGGARDQGALGANRELEVNADQAQHVGQDRALETVAQGLEVLADVRVLLLTAQDQLQPFHVAVETDAEPGAGRDLAPLVDGDQQQR